MSSLQIEAFRKLSKEDKKLLKDTYPFLYDQMLEMSTHDKLSKQLKKYSTKCKIDNLDKLTKQELIDCLLRKYPIFNEIKKHGGIQFKQFLTYFLCIVKGYKSGYIKQTQSERSWYTKSKNRNPGPFTQMDTFDIGPKKNLTPVPTLDETDDQRYWRRYTGRAEGNYSGYNITRCTGEPKQLPVDRWTPHRQGVHGHEGTTLPYFTSDQYLKMVNVLYPVLKRIPKMSDDEARTRYNYIKPRHITEEFIVFKNMVKEQIKVINNSPQKKGGPDKIINMLISIGHKIITLSFTEFWKFYFTQRETAIFRHNFKFSYIQIIAFLNILTKEQLLKILVNPEINLEELAEREPGRRINQDILPLH
jgi:hypothetical protein